MRRARDLVAYVVALSAVALLTALIAVTSAHGRIANVSVLYLPVVLVVAVRYGRGPAIVASVGAFVLFDFFFIEPRYQFAVGDTEGWISLLLLLLTAGVTGQLVADQRARTQEAAEREREALVLYDVVRLMAEPDVEGALHAVAERLRRELGLAGVAFELHLDGAAPRRIVAGDGEADRVLRAASASQVLGSGPAPTLTKRGGPGRWIRLVEPHVRVARAGAQGLDGVPITSSHERVGTLLLLRHRGHPPFSASDNRLLSAAAAQLGMAIERARLRREAAETDVLRRTDELKSALLDAVSHNLRTPLASILASASSLRQRDVTWTDQERDEFLAAIEEEARRLDRLVGNLLDLSRIEGGTLRPQKGWYDAGALVDDVLGRLRPVVARHRVVVRVSDDLPPVPLDYVEIDQVLTNLIENAAKYAPPGTEIEVGARREGDAVRFEVKDHGPGVPPDSERGLFAPFQRIARRDARQGLGIGLGLAVAKRLVEAHGGRIWLERPAGGGSCFAFALPAADEARA